jgi:hypothetical protein
VCFGVFPVGYFVALLPGQHRTYTRRLCPTEATQWTHLTWCCLLQVHQGGPVGSGVLGQLGSRCCSYRLSMALCVVVAGPAVAVWLLGYSRRGISPTLGDLACAAVRGCVLGYSQWGISLPLAAPGPGNRHDLASGGVRALRAARRCYCCCDLPTALELRDASCVRVWWWSSRVHRASVLAAAHRHDRAAATTCSSLPVHAAGGSAPARATWGLSSLAWRAD